MPTGYTAFIEDGTITSGKEFLKLCSRAFGIAMEIRDEPLSIPTPIKFEPNPYYLNKYKSAVKDLDEALAMTPETAKGKMVAAFNAEKESYTKYLSKVLANNERYYDIRKQVELWIPPTDEHKGIKRFALEQIDMCIEPQSSIKELSEKVKCNIDLDEASVNAFIAENIKFREDSVMRAKEDWENEIANAEKKNTFMQQFLDSLEKIDTTIL